MTRIFAPGNSMSVWQNAGTEPATSREEIWPGHGPIGFDRRWAIRDPDLVVRDNDGEIYTVRYDAVNAMLLNEFLKEHHKVADLESGAAQLTARLKEEDSKIQKVSAQLEASKPAPHVVNNNP